MHGRSGHRRTSVQNEGYISSQEYKSLDAAVRDFEVNRGLRRASFGTFNFQKPKPAAPETNPRRSIAMPASPAPAPAAPPVPSVADIIAYLEKQQAAVEAEAGRQALTFTRLFSQKQHEDAEAYRAQTMHLIGVMDAASTMIVHIRQQQPQ